MSYITSKSFLYGFVSFQIITIVISHANQRAIPASALFYIAAVLQVDIRTFFDDASTAILIDTPTLRLVEAYHTMQKPEHRDAIASIACGLAGK